MTKIPITRVNLEERHYFFCGKDHVIQVKPGKISFNLYYEIIESRNRGYPEDAIKLKMELNDSCGKLISFSATFDGYDLLDLLLQGTDYSDRVLWNNVPESLQQAFKENTFITDLKSVDDCRETHYFHAQHCSVYPGQPYSLYRKHKSPLWTFSLYKGDTDFVCGDRFRKYLKNNCLMMKCEHLLVENPEVLDESGNWETTPLDFFISYNDFPFGFLQEMRQNQGIRDPERIYDITVEEKTGKPQSTVILRQ